ncbi:alpha/beta hydrolase [Citrobacter sp. JGM124]|uniref:alpha/beta fold hydrolase n=1 Tax=Citrobacter sp. JGM124 TaxID=2799789 RepID=UPI001BAE3ACF|nr:alpha/beta hydrolase [Citrobacter sp. JGM124]MBS0848745.1 alpha/beta hydrolase [Citrobacter sp. JGM124]
MGIFDHQSGQFIRIDGADIYYETSGDPSNYPVILLHGGMDNLTSFNPLAEYLQHHYLIAIDTRGHGRSTLGEVSLSYQQLQSDVITVIKSLAITGCAIIGHSDGGIVALRIAAQQFIPLERVILVGAAWQLTDNDPVKTMYENMSTERWLQAFPTAEKIYQQLNTQPDFNVLMNAVRGMWLDRSSTGYPDSSISNINCPVLICRGDNDPLVSLTHSQEMAEQIKMAKLFNLPCASHSAHEERPEWLCGVFNHFLAADV